MSSRAAAGLQGMHATTDDTRAQTFQATVDLAGKTATGVRVPAEVVQALGSQRQPLVCVTIGDHSYRSKIAVRGGEFRLPISAENRAGAGIAAGDEIDVTLQLDTAPREVSVPADFGDALDADPRARRCFDALSYSRRQWFVLGIEGAKTPETRQRRIAKAVATLAEGASER
jgi:Bacteriocin-protection, YdeI or OmpD-Associated/Domain of unknown function (DUF1905)